MANLIIGGTSGLGLALARKFAEDGEKVVVTGRHDPKVKGIDYQEFDLTKPNLPARAKKLVAALPDINRLVYAAGYYQEGTVTDLSDEEIEQMIDVGGRGLIYVVKALLHKQNKLAELITITSTSHWTPRKLEPIYNFAKAGAGHLSNGLAEDDRIGKVLVAGPAGMDTPFWAKTDHDTSEMLEPDWVAKQVIEQNDGDFNYRFVKILRQPARVEHVETR